MKVFLPWGSFKAEIKDKSRVKYVDRETFYKIEYEDISGDGFECSIEKDDGADQTDFESHYKSYANKSKSIMPIDSDGSPLQRVKITTSGWHYQLHGLECQTSQLDSVFSKKEDGSDFGFCTIRCYAADGSLLTIQEDCDTQAVKTVVDWEPTHDYEIVGGFFKQLSIPTSDVRLWVVGVPDVPAVYGGSKLFCANINLKFIGVEEGIKVDGRAPKYMTYSATYHTNKLRMILKHDSGVKHNLNIIFEMFKN
jgi:hypothetical protein